MRLGFAVLLLPGVAAAQVHVDEGGVTLVPAPEGVGAWSWDTDGDGSFDDCADLAGCPFDATELDGPADVAIPVEIDGERVPFAIRIDNVPPTIGTVPPETVRLGLDYVYLPFATDPAGDRDPLVYALVDGAFPEGMFLDGAVVVWRPTPDDVGTHDVSVVVTDGDGGDDHQDWSVTVEPNEPPIAPAPFHADGCVDVEVTLQVANGVDLDDDPLTVFFEIDTDPGFRSIDLQQSPEIPEGPYGVTSWSPPRLLVPGVTFFWRAWVSDGAFESERVVDVLETCDEYYGYDDYGDYYDYDGYDYDGSDGSFEGDRHDSRGCSCWPDPPAKSDSADAGMGALALALLFFVRPRRS